MYTSRTRFKKDIVTEFLPPRKKSRNVVIVLGGMPSMPSKGAVLEFLSQKGYWAFYPRYRGTWESGGKFLRYSPEKDVLDILDELPRGFRDIYSGKIYRVKPEQVYLFGGSFGGPAAILASRDRRVTKSIAVSPVVDWRKESRAEPIDWMNKFVRGAFGEAYRYSRRDWNKLKTGTFYNPVAHIKEIDGSKLFIIHTKDDKSVLWHPVQKFAQQTDARFKLLKRGGHLSLNNICKPKFWKEIRKFLKT